MKAKDLILTNMKARWYENQLKCLRPTYKDNSLQLQKVSGVEGKAGQSATVEDNSHGN